MAYKLLKEDRPVIRGVLFDMDGVILDSEVLYTRFWREAAEQMGFPMTMEIALGLRSLSHDRGQKYLEQFFGPEVNYTAMRQLRIRLMDAWVEVHGVEPKPGAGELLDWLRERKLPCAITTSSPTERVKAHLTPLGLYDKFDAICSVAQVAHGKPEPDIYLFGAETLGLRPEECLAVEDSPTGLLSAWRAGCRAVMVPDRDQPDKETLDRCFALADSLTDLKGLLEDLI